MYGNKKPRMEVDMFGDGDISRAVNIEKLLAELPSLELNSYELWAFTSIRDLFSTAESDSDFRYAYSALLNYLVRNDEIDPIALQDEPLISDAYAKDKQALVACAVHFHLHNRQKTPPSWVYQPKYRIVNNTHESEHPIISYHGLNIPLNELGIVR